MAWPFRIRPADRNALLQDPRDGDTTAIQRFLPSTNQASVTAAIAVVATASAAATPLLLRVIKPVVKQLIKKVQKALGKEPPKLSANEMQTNKYREERGLPPFKRTKKSIINRYKGN